MKIMKALHSCLSLGEKIVSLGSKVTDWMDHIIHRKEYEAAQKRARVFRIILGAACGVLAVLFIPFKVKFEKNGDFEIKSLAMRVYRKTPQYDVPEGGNEEFDIQGTEDETAECEIIGDTANA